MTKAAFFVSFICKATTPVSQQSCPLLTYYSYSSLFFLFFSFLLVIILVPRPFLFSFLLFCHYNKKPKLQARIKTYGSTRPVRNKIIAQIPCQKKKKVLYFCSEFKRPKIDTFL